MIVRESQIETSSLFSPEVFHLKVLHSSIDIRYKIELSLDLSLNESIQQKKIASPIIIIIRVLTQYECCSKSKNKKKQGCCGTITGFSFAKTPLPSLCKCLK
jgi:hypothetical protein